MANTVKLKRSATAGDAPSASDLEIGEVAINTADGLLYTKHTDGTINKITIADDELSALLSGYSAATDATGSDLIVFYDVDAGVWERSTIANAALQGEKGQKGQAGAAGADGSDGSDGSDGDKGQKGEVGSKGQKGEAGATGNDGTSGSDGDKGQKGQAGNDGSAGSNGAKGQKGEVGVQGNDGGNGDKGQKGQKGQAGANGSSGSDGAKGQKGEKGQKGQDGTAGGDGSDGDKGQKGEVGAKGQKGQEGNFGGATFDYTFSTNTADSDPTSGKLKFNNANLSSASKMYIDNQDGSATSIVTFLRTIDDSTSTIKGHFRVSNRLNADDFALFTIGGSITEATGYVKVNCSYVSGSATSFTNNEDIIITFARTGDAGDTGAAGSDGSDGAKGQKGEKGQKGQTGAGGSNGTDGDKGQKGQTGNAGAAGSDGSDGGTGAKGQKGEVGAAGSDGNDGGTGDKGQKGEVGANGSNGSNGSKGEKGQKGEVGAGGSDGSNGSKGEKGQKGQTGGSGSDGSNGSKGEKGQKGQTGGSGSDGSDGTKGEKGQKGQTGGSGSDGSDGTKGQKGQKGQTGSGGSNGLKGQKGEGGLTTTIATKLFAGGTGPSTENLNTVGNNVSTGQLEYRGFNSSSSNAPPMSDNANGVITVGQHSGNYNAQLAFSSNGNMYWRDNPSSSNGSWRAVWDSGNDGSGSGLDADTVDGIQGSSFLRSDAADTKTGTLNLQANLDMRADNSTTNRYVHIPRGGGITFYGDASTHHSITSRNSGNQSADDILISSYGGVHIDLDSNNNNSSAANFTIGKHDGGTNYFTFNGETSDLTVSGNVTAYSDKRLKDNIETLDGSKVYDMRGVSFTKEGKVGSGVVAQELQAVAPELVNEDGEYLSVAYGNVVGYLIEAIKELKTEVDDLKTQLAEKE